MAKKVVYMNPIPSFLNWTETPQVMNIIEGSFGFILGVGIILIIAFDMLRKRGSDGKRD